MVRAFYIYNKWPPSLGSSSEAGKYCFLYLVFPSSLGVDLVKFRLIKSDLANIHQVHTSKIPAAIDNWDFSDIYEANLCFHFYISSSSSASTCLFLSELELFYKKCPVKTIKGCRNGNTTDIKSSYLLRFIQKLPPNTDKKNKIKSLKEVLPLKASVKLGTKSYKITV